MTPLHAAFLAEIRSGSDDAPRLIYADWLDEQGDPRASYLRAEVEAHALLRYTPPTDEAERQRGQELLTCLRELRPTLDPDWLAAIHRQDWMLVEGGTPETIKAATLELYGPTTADEAGHEIALFALPDGRHALHCSPRLSPGTFCTLLSFLDSHRQKARLSGVCGWLTSPGTGLRHFLGEALDQDSEYLFGLLADGTGIAVDAEAGYKLYRASRLARRVDEPCWSPTGAQPLWRMPFPDYDSDDPEWGNQGFALSSPTIERSQHHGILTEAQLSEFESRQGLHFPSDYRRFLLEHNGGCPRPNSIEFIEQCWRGPRAGWGMVIGFSGIHDGGVESLSWNIDCYRDRMPPGHVPIAWDPGGNQSALCVEGEKTGTVYFWNHENEAPDGEPTWFDNMSFVARSFTEFLSLLQVY